MKKHFFLFEGLDGSGKTTIAKIVANRLSADFYSSPPEDIKPLRAWADELEFEQTRLIYYLMGNSHATWQIRQSLNTNHVVYDRYLLSTIAYIRSIGRNITLSGIIGLFDIEMPTVTFILDVTDESVRLERVGARGASSNDLKNNQINEKLRHEFLQSDWPNRKYIDTSHLTIDEVEEEVWRVIQPIIS